jgi:hypothetical protein
MNIFSQLKNTRQFLTSNSVAFGRLCSRFLASNHRNNPKNRMFDNIVRVRIDQKENRAAISVRCKINENSIKELNLNRELNEEISATFQKLYANYAKHVSLSAHKTAQHKKLKKDDSNEDGSSIEKLNLDGDPLPLSLHDLDNNQLPLSTKNRDAWQEDFVFKLRDQVFRVNVNLPSVKAIKLPKLMIAGLPTLIKIDIDSDHSEDLITQNSVFAWYSSDLTFNQEELDASKAAAGKKKPVTPNLSNVKWELLEEGVGKRFHLLEKTCANKYIKVECRPSDGKRSGVVVDYVSTGLVREPVELENTPMFQSHALTKEKLSGDR